MKAKLRVNAIRSMLDPCTFTFTDDNNGLIVELDTPYKGQMQLYFNSAVLNFNEDGIAFVPRWAFTEGEQVITLVAASGRQWPCSGVHIKKARVDEQQAMRMEESSSFYKGIVERQGEEISALKKNVSLLISELEKVEGAVNKLQNDIDKIFIELNS